MKDRNHLVFQKDHVFHFKLIRYEARGESPTAEATTKSEEKPQEKKRCRRRRAMLRLQAFLQTKCSICHTPRETPSRPLPCCAKYVHEQCLVVCLDYPGSQQQKCPCCGGTLFLLNDGEEFPSQRPEEESRVFLLFHSPHNKIVAELPVAYGRTLLPKTSCCNMFGREHAIDSHCEPHVYGKNL